VLSCTVVDAGYVTVKLNPQLRQRSVTVTRPSPIYKPAIGWHSRAGAAVFGNTEYPLGLTLLTTARNSTYLWINDLLPNSGARGIERG
jgi:hypothetical protein